MNSNRILNLPAPSDNTEPVRRYDLDVAIKGIVDFQNTLTEKVSEASDYATQAETSAVSAYSSYVLASAYADSLNAVSTTSNAIENGSKVFSIQTGKQFKNGQYVLISYAQDVTKYLYGYVTDYTGSSLTVQVVATQGSGTYADWTIGLSAIRGPQGEVGPKGDTGAQGPQGLQGPTGNTGPSAWAAPVAWQTGQSYTASAPASVVTQGGETYVCIISHTSGTFATDLAASKWLKIAAKGADGSGTGDMLKADNLSGLANVATARTNLGATTVGSALFTAADASAARSNIYAAPFDALAYSGMQINGSMEVSQEFGTATRAIPTGTQFLYAIDCWRFDKSGSSALSAQQVASGLPGFAKSLRITVSTAQPSIGTDTVSIVTPIEGYRFARAGWGTSGAVPISVGFWIKAPVTGTIGVRFANFDWSATAYATNPVVTAANTWQFVTATFPAQTSGTWKADNSLGAQLSITIASSSTINAVASTSYVTEITGLIVLPGVELPSAARGPLIMRPYDQELLLCKRYYQKTYVESTNVGTATQIGELALLVYTPYIPHNQVVQFASGLRAVPTVTLYSSQTGATGAYAKHDTSDAYVSDITNYSVYMPSHERFRLGLNGQGVAGNFVHFHYTADARL